LSGLVDTLGPIENPLGINGLEDAPNMIEGFSYAALGLAVVVSLLLRFRHASALERQHTKWLAYTASVVLVGAILAYGVSSVTEAWWGEPLGVTFLAVGFAGVPIAMGIAILKHRLYEIDIIINHTLVYGTLTVVLAGIFQAIDAALHFLLLNLLHHHSFLGSIVSALVVAALFHLS
jgi:hypothetical protein